MKNLCNKLRNEKGNTALFVLGMLSIMVVLFVFVINMGQAFITKEKSQTTVEQASMVASSIVYEKVREIIFEYRESDYFEEHFVDLEPPGEGASPADWEQYYEDLEVYEYFTEFEERVNDAKDGFPSIGAFGWSDNERELEAFEQVVSTGLANTNLLGEILSDLLNGSVNSDVIYTAMNTIEKHNGTLEDAELKIEGNRIHVEAANEMDLNNYQSFYNDVEDKVYQQSAGPVIDFLEIIWVGSKIVSLDPDPDPTE